jgi:anaerobic selenocysteine-containing dehydrogenase
VAELAATIDQPRYAPGGPESSVLSVCRECPGGCGVRVRCIAGQPVKVDGNPLHPVSGGRLCPKGQAALQTLYHPDRIRGPLRRTGPRGSIDSFRPASWDEALEEIALRLRLLRRQERPESLAMIRGTSRGVDTRLAKRFMQAFGSPNEVVLPRGDIAASQALSLTQGVRAVPSYDLQAAEYVLSLGGSLLEASGSPVHTMRAYGELRQGRTGRRGKLVHVGPRLSITGAAADEWVEVNPGTEGILALGIAGVLVAEDLYDKSFVQARTHQFDDYRDADGTLRPGLASLLAGSYRLERVALETGVSVNRILRVARELAAARPGIAIGPRGGPLLSGRLFDHLAAHVLNGLAGNVDAPGGVLVPDPVPLPLGPELPSDPVAERGRARPRIDGAGRADLALLESDARGLAEGFFSRSPYEIEALLVLDADPAFASTAPDSFAAALEEVPLVVSFASLPDDTSLLSDWILPRAHPFEGWELDLTPPGVPFPLASLATPVLAEPLHDVRPVGETLMDLARRIGGGLEQAFPWKDLPARIRSESAALYESHRGAVIGTEFDEAWVRLMERSGWWAPGYRSEAELWKRMLETGGWWDPFYDHRYWTRVLRTESGRFEFRPQELVELEEKRRVAPESEELHGLTAIGELALVLFEPLAVAGGSGAEQPFLQEILDPGHEARWETWVEINPHTAEHLHVADRALVSVSSAHGAVVARARVTERVVPGVAALPIGLGKRSGGRWARGVGSNPLHLLSPLREALSGLPDLGATRVRVAPANAGSAGGEV